MTEGNKDKKAIDSYDEFLNDVNQFARKEEEKAFMDSLNHDLPAEDTSISIGERVRAVRRKQGLSLRDVSQRTGMDVDLLSQIEEGKDFPPLGTVIRLAKALEMRMGYFISGEESKAFTIVRKADRKVVSRYDSKKVKRYGYEYQSLAPHKKDRHMDPFMVNLEPSETEEERSAHEGQEFIFVMSGMMEVRLGEEIHLLEPGDSIYYDSTVPHLVKCHGSEAAKILAVLYTEK